jgi:hypothetical protein
MEKSMEKSKEGTIGIRLEVGAVGENFSREPIYVSSRELAQALSGF